MRKQGIIETPQATLGAILGLLLSSCSNSTPTPQSTQVPGVTCSVESRSATTFCSAADPAPSGNFAPLSGNNVMAITVSPSCPGGTCWNIPFVSVTLCSPGSKTQCQTINDIVVDTGSFGLRIFGSQITQATGVAAQVGGGKPVGDCAEFGSANTWGSIELYDVQLGGETLSDFPIQQIDASYAGGAPPSSGCSQMGVVSSPSAAGFNGILGVGLLRYASDEYYECSGNSCAQTSSLSASETVQNPVASLSTDNNGVMIQMPPVSSGGQGSATGYLAFGVGTETNNKPSSWGVTNFYEASLSDLMMLTTYNSVQFGSFIDSGSNANYVPDCFASTNGWLTPGCSVDVSATNASARGAGSGGTLVSFQIGDENTLSASGNSAFNNLSGSVFEYPGIGPIFDWGLSFFYGRTIFVGIQGQPAAAGELPGATGPYWAY